MDKRNLKTIGKLLEESLCKYEKRELVYDEVHGVTFTYIEFNTLVNDISKGLIFEGVKKGEHIGILENNSIYWLASFCAICNIGAIAVLLNTELTRDALLYAMNYADISFLFTSDSLMESFSLSEFEQDHKVFRLNPDNQTNKGMKVFIENAKEVSDETLKKYIVNVKNEDIASMQFTSGTTGAAKAVLTSHESIYLNVKDTAKELEYTQEERVILGTPLFHILGYIGTALTVYSVGAFLCMIGRYSTTRALQVIEEKECTSFHGVPTMYQLLASKCEKYDISSLKNGLIAGASVNSRIISECFHTLGLKHMANIYGQTETLSIGTIHYRKEEDFKKRNFTLREGIIAKVMDLHKMREEKVNSIGELFIKTDNAMVGYYKNEEQTSKVKNGQWIRTGDLAVKNADGTIRVKGRRGDIVIRGGENILVTELERKFLKHPLIQNVAVFGVKDKLFGEEIAAFIEQNVEEEITKEELDEFVKTHFSKIERPKFLRIIKHLPVNSIGKINKLSLSSTVKNDKRECDKDAV